MSARLRLCSAVILLLGQPDAAAAPRPPRQQRPTRSRRQMDRDGDD